MDLPVGNVTFLHQRMVPDRTESWPDNPNLGLAGRRPAWPSDDDDDDDDCYDYHLYCPELLPFEEPFEELQAPV